MRAALGRELRVAFSRRGQPVWFRVVKWVVIVGFVVVFWGRWWLGWVMGGAIVLAVPVHLFYRWKTRGWTRAWGGWDDLEAGKGGPRE